MHELHRIDFCHRTFNSVDLHYFLHSLRNIYQRHGGLESVYNKGYRRHGSIREAHIFFREVFLELDHPVRTEKHIANVLKNASAKRLNMFLRWMVRNNNNGVDFGLWKQIPASDLFIPLDVHSGRIARAMGLLTRKQNDWIAVEELTRNLRKFDFSDPVKYDFALFGMGVFEENDSATNRF